MKIGFLFPGQGSQVVGMCKDFYEKYEIAKKILNSADDILGYKITNFMFNGPENELKDTKNAQIAIFLHSMVVDILLKENGIFPDYVAGHSVGQFSAMVSSEIITFEEGVKILKLRGELMSEVGMNYPGKMAAIIGIDAETVESVCKEISLDGGIVNIANYNSPKQVVISGDYEGVKRAIDKLTSLGAKRVVMLSVSAAFHSPLMQEASEKFSAVLDTVEIKNAKIPLIGNTTGEIISKKDEIINEIKKHMLSPVKWHDSMKKMFELGVNIFVEVGCGKILKGLLLEINRSKRVFCTLNVEEFEYTLKCLKQL